jgi:hypothetical protein
MIGDGGELDTIARHVADELPGAAADRLLAELLLAHLLDVGLGHDRAFGCHGARQAGRQADLRAGRVHLHCQVIDNLDVLDGALHARGGGGERTRPHLPLEAELDVVRRQLVTVVEGLAGPDEEGPGQAVGRHFPTFGDAGTDTAFLEIEADQRIVHDRLVDGVARPAFEDRVERLGAERFNGEDERAFLVLGVNRRDRADERGDGESQCSRKLPNHELLPERRRFVCLVVGTQRQRDYRVCFETGQ